jgi:tRNA A37 threonylcarbamoyladenosine dehydratase
MDGRFSRTERLLGRDNIEKLSNARVALFGVGGVGGYVAEALARSGIGHFVLIDDDSVALSNLNRQIIALHSTLGRNKAKVMADRIADINPLAKVEARDCFYLPENADSFDFSDYSYVVDAVDTVTAKLEIIQRAKSSGVPVISSMGAGNKLDPSKFEVADIYKTSVDPLARVMRRELKKRGVRKLKVVYSKEEPLKPLGRIEADPEAGRKDVPGSSAFTPSAAGLLIASEVVKDLIGFRRN